MNQITFNQELIDDIYSANVQEELHTIKDFLRWCYSTFNRADIYYGHGYDNAWDEAQQLALATLHLLIFQANCMTPDSRRQKSLKSSVWSSSALKNAFLSLT